MADKTTESVASFRGSFTINDTIGIRPSGDYRVVVEEDAILDASFLAYRRVATLFYTPALGANGAMQVFPIRQAELDSALRVDRSSREGGL